MFGSLETVTKPILSPSFALWNKMYVHLQIYSLHPKDVLTLRRICSNFSFIKKKAANRSWDGWGCANEQIESGNENHQPQGEKQLMQTATNKK